MASPMPLVPPNEVLATFYLRTVSCVSPRIFVRRRAFQSWPRCSDVVFASSGAATSAPSGHRAQGCWLRQVDAGDLDDGLPRGFLAGAIVEVWLALHLDWA